MRALLPPKPTAPIETNELKKGDVVQLRSGGAAMTVLKTTTSGKGVAVYVVYHDERGINHDDIYSREALIRVR